MRLIKFSVTQVMIMPIIMKELTENKFLKNYTPYLDLWECGFKSAKMRGYDLILEFDDRVNQSRMFNDYIWTIPENSFNEVLIGSKYFKDYDGRYIYDLSEFKEYIDIVKTSNYSKLNSNIISIKEVLTISKRNFGHDYYKSNLASYIINGGLPNTNLRKELNDFLKSLGNTTERFKAWQKEKEEVLE